MPEPSPPKPPAEPTPLSVAVAENFKAARMALGESQAQTALRTGIGQKSISEIECGRANPTLHTLEALARHVGLTVAQLLAPPHL